MAEEGKLEKLKEQYVDEVLGIVPLSQAVFIVLMSLVSDRILSDKSDSVLSSLTSLGLKSSLGPDAGRFWDVSVMAIVVAFVMALFNMYLLRTSLHLSLKKANLGVVLSTWQAAATHIVQGLTDAQKLAIQVSFKSEIEARLRKYKAKRISTELISSITGLLIYSTFLLVYHSYSSDQTLQWSFVECGFFAASALISVLLHRSSVSYAIVKILPIKVYLGVLTGELVFFEELTS